MMASESSGVRERNVSAIVVDTHLLFAESFKCMLSSYSRFGPVFCCNRETEMWNALEKGMGTHLFLDYHLLGLQVSAVLRKIRAGYPAVKLIMLVATHNLYITQRMFRLGAMGLLSKFGSVAELSDCLRAVDIGRKYISPDIRLFMRTHENVLHPVNFTQKEIMVLQFIARGFTISQTAEQLRLSTHTIVAHRRHIMEKAGINSAAGLVKFGMDAGLI